MTETSSLPGGHSLSSKGRTSIFDVAKAASCSIATVSNVLNDKGRVSKAKKKAVLKAVAELGYQVSSMGRNLRMRRTETLGLLFYPSCAEIFRNVFYAEVMEGLEEFLTHESYHLLLAGYNLAANEEGIPDFLYRGKVDGLILLGRFPSCIVQNLQSHKAPLVLLDSNVEWPVDSVVSDGFSGVMESVRHLVRLGHRRLLMMAYPHEDSNIDLRVQGFLTGLREAGLAEEGAVMRTALSHDDLYRDLRERLDGPQPPTAMVAVNDTLATVMIQRLAQDGIRVPERLSVVGFDDDAIAAQCDPPLTTVSVDKKELGRIGGSLILQRLHDPAAPVAKLRTPTALVERASTAPPR